MAVHSELRHQTPTYRTVLRRVQGVCKTELWIVWYSDCVLLCVLWQMFEFGGKHFKVKTCSSGLPISITRRFTECIIMIITIFNVVFLYPVQISLQHMTTKWARYDHTVHRYPLKPNSGHYTNRTPEPHKPYNGPHTNRKPVPTQTVHRSPHKPYTGSHTKCPLSLSDLIKLPLSRYSFQTTQMPNFMQIHLIGELFHVHRGTDWRTDLTEVTVFLHNFVIVPKNSVRTSQKTQ
jgi:hypothetical protein